MDRKATPRCVGMVAESWFHSQKRCPVSSEDTKNFFGDLGLWSATFPQPYSPPWKQGRKIKTLRTERRKESKDVVYSSPTVSQEFFGVCSYYFNLQIPTSNPIKPWPFIGARIASDIITTGTYIAAPLTMHNSFSMGLWIMLWAVHYGVAIVQFRLTGGGHVSITLSGPPAWASQEKWRRGMKLIWA